MDITKRFGDRVRKLRQQQNLSQNELADKCGLHRTYIGSVERGERNITIINGVKIAKALSLELFQLLQEDKML